MEPYGRSDPVSCDRTSAVGCASRNSPQATVPIGIDSSFSPVSTPIEARPVSWGHSDSVCRSYITRLSAYSIPDVPKERTRLSSWRRKVTPELHSGQ
ncbi:hypothetical protein GCM10011376_35380 [Nocardioides flavus (ex Wang et al. 2016)]|uniref:Uncharacterized protein n=1 Tax=Nocardioides flavus (ex Wang et al. 2016) TaxID=2058780 RepID=A0ABQ3HML5_9ACTN|nr:hypothetical protein GCM10011376_35380 [Nocardioides flavus (ex Wang et al. 2016)]